MTGRPLIRPGGRSERIQKAVHAAVRELLGTCHRNEPSIALIAARADVPPSTIYRRWGTLAELLAAVASDTFHPDFELLETGTFRGDLEAWLRNLVDDLSSGPGRALMRERLENTAVAQRAAGYAYANLETLTRRASDRGEAVPPPELLMDIIVAPVMYRLAFVHQRLSPAYQQQLINRACELPLRQHPNGEYFCDDEVFILRK